MHWLQLVGVRVIALSAAVSAFVDTQAHDRFTQIRVIDGDTFEGRHALLGRPVKVRLAGVDAPERGRPGFLEASEVLRDLIAAENVACVDTGDRSFDRWVMTCSVDGRNIEAALVERGVATWRRS